MTRIELSPMNQQILEERCHNRIRVCNTNIRKNLKTYNDWENAGTRLHSQYTQEEYKQEFIDYWYKQRRYSGLTSSATYDRAMSLNEPKRAKARPQEPPHLC